MKAIVKRIQKLEMRSTASSWSWTTEFDAVAAVAAKQMPTEDLILLEPVLAHFSRPQDPLQAAALRRWEETFDRTAREMQFHFNAADRWL